MHRPWMYALVALSVSELGLSLSLASPATARSGAAAPMPCRGW